MSPQPSLWDLVEHYCNDTGATEAAILRKADLNKGTFAAWRKRGIPTLPARDQLVRLAAVLKVDYETLLVAVLHDVGYLDEERK